MFNDILKRKKVNKNVYAIQYYNGVINIKTEYKTFVYYCHSISSAIKEFRKENKYKRN